MQPEISVSMPVYRPDPSLLKSAIESILVQSCQNLELILVEDPSEQPAGPVVAQIADTRVRHFVNRQRTSLIEQRNRCWQESRAEFVALLDADDIAEPDRLQKQAEFLNAHPTVGVVGSHLRIIDEAGNTLGFRSYPSTHHAIVRTMPFSNPIGQPSVMFRRRVVQSVGGYKYRKYGVCSDYELWSRLAKQSVEFANLTEPLTRYRIHGKSLKSTRLRDSIRATLDIKRTYWSKQMTLAARARCWAESLLLFCPPQLTLQLFRKTHFTRQHV